MKLKAYTKKWVSLSLAGMMACSTLAGCGSKAEDSAATTGNGGQTTTAAGETTGESQNQEAGDKPYAGVKLKWAIGDNAAQGQENIQLVELVKERTGIEIEFTIVPPTKSGEIDKTLVSLMAGDEFDLIVKTPSGLKPFYNAGVLEPLDELAANSGYDMKSVFGDTLTPYEDGKLYVLPSCSDIWTTYYNKKIFDDAGIPYPTAENWTWEKYIETAKMITDLDNGIYGSFMNDYDNFNYMLAFQKGAVPYKEDGTSNFDDPLYKESMKFYYDFGNELKVQPTSAEYAAGLFPYNAFMTTGQMGMFVCGSWVATTLTDQTKYPRDWQAGILPMPYPEGHEKSSLTISTAYAIPSTSKNKEAAFEAIRVICEEQYSLGYGRIPARVDIPEDEMMKYIEEKVAPRFEKDGITAEELKKAWFDPSRKLIAEKIVGPADASISQIWIEEGQLYGQGMKDIDEAIASIKARADEAIKEENE